MKKLLYSINKIGLLTTIFLMAIFFSHCKKYEEYNTAIEIILPESGMHTFWLDSEFWTIRGDQNDRVTIVIDWEKIDILYVNGRQVSIISITTPNKERYSLRTSLKPGLVYEWDPLTDEINKTGKKLKKNDFSRTEKDQLIGKWQQSNCNGEDAEYWLFNMDGTGIYRIPGCNQGCDNPSLLKFEWSENTGSEVFLDISEAADCIDMHRLPILNDTTLSYSISESELNINGKVYESN